MYKRILVAVDGSETADAALQEAIKLAKDHDSQIRLLHVVDLTMAYSAVEAPYIFEYRKSDGRRRQKGPRRLRGIAAFRRDSMRIEMRGDVCRARLRRD
jgi:nucleotide-binding universal stress UspA family protein